MNDDAIDYQLAVACPKCGAPRGTSCRTHLYGYDYPPLRPKTWGQRWDAFWFWFKNKHHRARHRAAWRHKEGR